jgi:DNA-binding XRE family transcriptional regulator
MLCRRVSNVAQERRRAYVWHMTVLPVQQKVPPITLAHRLRIAREWRGLEQHDLARELGVGRSTISNYERGVTSPGKLVVNAWAVVTDVDVEWLRNDDYSTPPVGPAGIEPTTSTVKVRRLVPRSTAGAPRVRELAIAS